MSPLWRATSELRPSAPKTSRPENSPRVDDAVLRVDVRDGGFGEEFGPGGLRFATEPVVEHVPGDGAGAALRRAEGVLVERAAFDVDVEPGDFTVGQCRVGVGQAQLFPDVPRGGVDAVAADFGAGKGGAVEQRDAMPGPGQDKRGEGTGGRGADDDDVVGGHRISRKRTQRTRKWN